MSPETLTIESALADPMIQALMRADRVKSRDLEALLRDAARTVRRETFRVPASCLWGRDGTRRPGACLA